MGPVARAMQEIELTVAALTLRVRSVVRLEHAARQAGRIADKQNRCSDTPLHSPEILVAPAGSLGSPSYSSALCLDHCTGLGR
jgi:hypothetical protein